MPRRIPDPAPELMARARRLYLETDTSPDDIAKIVGLQPRTFHTRCREWGWPVRLMRRARPLLAEPAGEPCELPLPPLPPLAADGPAPVAGFDASGSDGLATLALRLERLVARRLDRLEAEAAAGRDHDPDGTDRRLIQLERLLAQLGKRRGQDGEFDEPGPPARSVADLRDELLRHLERVRQQARSRKLPGRPDPG